MILLFILTSLQLFPLIRAIRSREIDFLSFLGVSHFIGYSLVPWYQFIFERDKFFIPRLPYVLLIAGSATLGGIYYFLKSRMRKTPILSDPYVFYLNPNLTLVCLFLTFVCMRFSPPAFQFYFAGAQFLFLVIAVKFFSKENRVESVLHFSSLLFLGFYSYLEYRNVTFPIFLTVLMGTVALFHRTRRPLAFATISLLTLVFLQTQKGEYRAYLGGAKSAPLIEKLELFNSIVEHKYFGGAAPRRYPSGIASEAVEKTASRLHDDSLHRIMAQTPSKIPYSFGRTYRSFFYLLFLPLQFPWGNPWNEFGKKYGYLSSNDEVTEVVFSIFSEGWMNFGYLGFFLEALIVGLILVGLERLCARRFSRFSFEAFLCLLFPMLSYQMDLGSSLARVAIAWVLLEILRLVDNRVSVRT